MPSSASFEPYRTTSIESSSKRAPRDELLLKSESHPKLDYTAREEGQSSTEPRLKHYLGIFDPKTGELELIEAKKMVVRATVREKGPSTDDVSTSEVKPVRVLSLTWCG